jgi:hypothetical protein
MSEILERAGGAKSFECMVRPGENIRGCSWQVHAPFFISFTAELYCNFVKITIIPELVSKKGETRAGFEV